MGQADTRVDILLALKTRIENADQALAFQKKFNTGLKDIEAQTARTVASSTDQFDKFAKKLEGKFSLSKVGVDIVKGFGIGSGMAVLNLAVDGVVRLWNQAKEDAKEFKEYIEKAADDLKSLHNLRFTNLLETLSPSQQLVERQKQLATLTARMADLETKRAEGVRLVGVAATGESNPFKEGAHSFEYGGKSYSPKELGEFGATKAEEAFQKWKQVAEEREQVLTTIRQLKKAVAEDPAAKERSKVDGSLVGINAKITADFLKSADKQDAALEAQAQAYREAADPAEVFRRKIAEVGLLQQTGRLSAEAAAAAIARFKAEMGHDLENAIDASNEALRKFNTNLGAIENNPALTDTEKHQARIMTLRDENVEIAKQIDLLKDFAKGHPGVDPAAVRGQIRGLEDRSVRNATEADRPVDTLLTQRAAGLRDFRDPAKHYQSAGAGFAGSMADQAAQLGTVGDQVARAWTATGDAIRSSLSGAFADAVLTGGTATEKINAFALSMETAFVQSGAQMVADWIWSHAIMGSVKKMFVAEDTGLTVTGEVIKSGAVAAGAATNTAVVAGEAAGIAAVTGPAAILRSIMELGPIAGPIVMGLSIAGMLALLAGLTGGFEAGGYTGNVDTSRIAGVVHGREYVMDAATTSRLGVGFLDTLRSSPSPVAALAAAPAAGGYGLVNGGRQERTVIIDGRDHDLIGRMEADPRYNTHFVRTGRNNRGPLGLPS